MTWLSRRKPASARQDALVGQFRELKTQVESLPPLTPAARAEFDHGVDLDHLYYSSKIEGTSLTAKEIKRAVNERAS